MTIPNPKAFFFLFALLHSLSVAGQAATALFQTQVIRTATTPAPFLFFENLGKKEGVPADIQKIYQDKTGYLWFCLPEGQGVARFDGSKFTRFQQDANPISWSGSTIFDLLHDRADYLWCSTNAGIWRYEPGMEKFRSIPVAGKPSFGNFFEDSKGRIWVGTQGNGLWYYDPSRDSMVVFPGMGVTNGYTNAFFSNSSFDGFFDFAETPDGLIWATAAIFSPGNPPRYALLSLNPEQHDIRFYTADAVFRQKPVVQPIPGFFHFYFDADRHCFWLGGYASGLLRFSLNDHSWERFSFSDHGDLANNVLTIARRNADQLWLGGDNGLRIFDIPRRQLYPIQTGASSEPCLDIYEDRHGMTWFAHKNSLSSLSPYRQQFPLKKHQPANFPAEAMLEMPITGELLLLAYDEKGVFRALAGHPGSGKWRSSQQTIGLPTKNRGHVWAVQVAADGKIWVGLDGGVGWLDPHSLRLTLPRQALLRDQENQRSDQLWVADLCPGEQGDMWIATWNAGLVQYDARKDQFICHTYQLGGTNQALFGTIYRSVYQAPSGRLFLGGQGNGLETWNPANHDYRQYAHNPQNPKSIGGRFVFCMEADKKGQLWLGTENGLCRYLPDAPPDSAFERCHVPQVWIHQITMDRRDRLWLKTTEGLILYDPTTNQSTFFGDKQGMTLPFEERRPLYADRFNTIWYGPSLLFDPDSIRPLPLRVRPKLTGLKIHDQPWVGNTAIGVADHIDLEPQENTLRFEMTALDFDGRPGESLFQVKFDKGDDDSQWTDLGTQNFATFANLAPGTYHFRFLAGNAESGWMPTADARHLKVVIHPYFYQTWWFRVLLAAVVLGMVATATAFYYRYQLRAQQLLLEKQQREAERQRLELEKAAAVAEGQRKAAESEMKLLRSQLNPHFLFNAMNSVNRYILSNERDKASEYLGQFAQLTRSILDNSRSLTIPLADELKMLHHYLALENHRFQQQIHWTFTVSPDLDEEDVLVPSMFLQPFAENAVLHGLAPKGGGHIAVEISQQAGSLQCIIRDDGVGRQPTTLPNASRPPRSSVGMRLIAERLDAFAALEGQSAAFAVHDLKDAQGRPVGTEVVIRLPLVQSI